MSRLTKDSIKAIFSEELQRAQQMTTHQWAHPFTTLSFTKSKKYFGFASTRGEVKLSEVFINTEEEAKLRDTIRHEFAHLIVGIRHGHDTVWSHTAQLLGSRGTRLSKPTGGLVDNMKAKYKLVAHTTCGNQVVCGISHVKKSKYLGYKLSATNVCKLSRGKIVVKFTYERNV